MKIKIYSLQDQELYYDDIVSIDFFTKNGSAKLLSNHRCSLFCIKPLSLFKMILKNQNDITIKCSAGGIILIFNNMIFLIIKKIQKL